MCAPMALSVSATAQETIVVAQEKKRRTLFDLLFGPSEEQKKPASTQRRASPSIVNLPPPTPAVDKADTATRLAVFGDSLGVDLVKALERFYAEDPNLVVIEQGVGSSGFVRDDFFDWNKAIGEAIADNTFDLAVIVIGINDRQEIGEDNSLTDPWKQIYSARLSRFLGQLRAAGKPVVWVGLPPMRAGSYSTAMAQISSLHRQASFSGGAEFVDIFERFANEEGGYTSYGPDLNGNNAQMRKSDGIHFARAGADKLAVYVNQSLKLFYRGGTVTIEIADLLDGTDAKTMVRMPFQGMGQIRLLQVAGAVVPLTGQTRRASQLALSTPAATEIEPASFELEALLMAPVGRADSFGAGIDPSQEEETETN